MAAKRQAFTTEEKIALRARKEECPILTQKELAVWFEEMFQKPIKQHTVSEWLSGRYSHLKDDAGPPKAKKQRREKFPELERALSQWGIKHQGKGVVSGGILKQKALFFWQHLPQYSGLPPPNFSNGWLEGFKNRRGVKEFVLHGEAGSLSDEVVAAEVVGVVEGVVERRIE